MKTYTVYSAKTQLSRLIEQVRAGEEVVIARGKTPLVKLVPLNQPANERRFGAMRGKATVTDAYFDVLPGDELRVWEQCHESPIRYPCLLMVARWRRANWSFLSTRRNRAAPVG